MYLHTLNIHPYVQTFAGLQVAGVVGRAEMLSAIFFLLSIFAYREAVLERKGKVQLGGSVLLNKGEVTKGRSNSKALIWEF